MRSEQKYKVLVVDEDQDTIDLLQEILIKENYRVEVVSEGSQVLFFALKLLPDLVLMEVNTPRIDGIEIGRQLKLQPSLTDILLIYLTTSSDEQSEIAAFEIGADSYLNKPVKPRALIGRLHSLLSRRDRKFEEVQRITLGDLTIDRIDHKVYKGKRSIPVAKKEFELLYFLAKNPNELFTRPELINEVWGTKVYILDRTIDVHIRKLREKLGDESITTVKGLGYRLEWRS
jgi:two-component system alkaline phosphatase synthesis response regulator PhoP